MYFLKVQTILKMYLFVNVNLVEKVDLESESEICLVFLDLFPLSAFASPLAHLTSAKLNQLHMSDSGENRYSLFCFLRLGEIDACFCVC